MIRIRYQSRLNVRIYSDNIIGIHVMTERVDYSQNHQTMQSAIYRTISEPHTMLKKGLNPKTLRN